MVRIVGTAVPRHLSDKATEREKEAWCYGMETYDIYLSESSFLLPSPLLKRVSMVSIPRSHILIQTP